MTCEKIIDTLEAGKIYELIFLDIEFPKMNGIELSRYLRNVQRNIKTQIVFISAKDSYAMELFSVQPFDFLVKPIEYDSIYTIMNKYIDYYHKSNFLFTYTYENSKHQISVDSIIYIKSKGKQLVIHTDNNDISIYQKLSDVLSEQLKSRFIVIRRGVAVNIDHIVMSDYERIILSDKTEFKISRRSQSDVRRRLSYDIGGEK